jgi:hypothetical protein
VLQISLPDIRRVHRRVDAPSVDPAEPVAGDAVLLRDS